MVSGLLAAHRIYDPSPHLNEVVGIRLVDDEHRHPGVPANIFGPLALWFGVNQEMVTVGVDPRRQGLGLAIWHQRHCDSYVVGLGEALHVRVKSHVSLPMILLA